MGQNKCAQESQRAVAQPDHLTGEKADQPYRHHEHENGQHAEANHGAQTSQQEGLDVVQKDAPCRQRGKKADARQGLEILL